MFDVHVAHNFSYDVGCDLGDELLVEGDFTVLHHVRQLLCVLGALQHLVGVGEVLGRGGSFMIGIDLALHLGQPNQLMREEDALRGKINQELLD